MDCKHFGICGSCTFDIDYNEQIDYKKNYISDKFKTFYNGEFEIFKSEDKNYRSRAEFGLFHDGDELYYTMSTFNKKRVFIQECPKVDIKIANLMPKILLLIKNNDKLKHKIFGIEFISTKKEVMAILLYHKNILDIDSNLKELSYELNIKLIARSRGKKLVFKNKNLNEELFINEKKYFYTFEDSAFIQPNRKVNEKMISWAISCIKNGSDFLEMYCGHGNFTIPLSFKFDKVLATEISKSSIKNALKNCELNNIKNIDFIRLPSEELIQAFNGVREFHRLENLDLNDFNFSHILVDPPRAGLDEIVVKFIKNYENIIYISCNPDTLFDNLEEICKSHEIIKFAIFDQFAHTKHLECGVFLKKK